MSDTTTYFWALEPDEDLSGFVRDCKKQVRDLAGKQQFLGDPPHATLYLACYDATKALCPHAKTLVRELSVLRAELSGWHVFEADPLTGKRTLVCGVSNDTTQDLHKLQQELVNTVAPLRDHRATGSRYEVAWPDLAADERASIEKWGFPYVGHIWRPHVTIASISEAAWPSVWQVLRPLAPEGTVAFPTLCLYALDGEVPVIIKRFRLGSGS